ncbi:putative disease resistance protein RXW24L [Apium graveolens]|uniref:putative disease resistance protein RXW24L n=1 Tax=Apium graveolens TaxID=4045 RepID=UPI003D794C13
MNALKDEITSITTSLQTYGVTKGLPEGETSSSSINVKSKRVSYSHTFEKYFVGMENELKQLISSLNKEDKGCEIVSICGMGGQGKTTLAQKLYNHAQVQAYFKKFAWVCITQQFDREKILKEVLKQLIDDTRKNEVTNMDDGGLVRELYNVQKENNCLVVLDDIWTYDSWRLLKDAFPDGETTSDSKILLTTRNQTVAEIGHIHKIECLTTEEGWQLLSRKAIIHDRSGGILNGKSLREWEMINKDISYYLGEDEGGTMDDEYYTVRQVLGLSYDNLSPRLRHCFLCFANFKEDEAIDTEELYILWTAEGLVSVEHIAEGKISLDVAESYLDELAHRSLVQGKKSENKEFSWSKYETCSVHDLIRDLCLAKAKEEKFIKVIHLQSESENESSASIARRLCISPYNEYMLKPYAKDMTAHVRSLFVRNKSDIFES